MENIATTIQQKLVEIEKEKNVRILMAVESGSRGWGFHSPDSDYDVRFIYAHDKDWYLTIQDRQDFMNVEVNEVYDVVGYDVRKALKFFYAGNSKIYEWVQSPIFYRKDEQFVDALQSLIPQYYLPRKGLHHYLGLTRNTLTNSLESSEVKLKKYFYALRPVMAACWIHQRNECPPMEFQFLKQLIEDDIIAEKVEAMLTLKKDADEKQLVNKDESINTFIFKKMKACEAYANTLQSIQNKVEPINQLFRQTIGI